MARHIEVTLDGFYGFRIEDATGVAHPGGKYAEVRTVPVLVAVFRMPAPFADVALQSFLVGAGIERWWLAGRPRDTDGIRRWLNTDGVAQASLMIQWDQAIHKLLARDEPAVLI